MRVRADVETCVGAGQCVLSAPDVFDQDDDGIVRLLQDAPPPDAESAVRLAGRTCPSRSVHVDVAPG
ncbi:4Fe-4S domain-containing protein [Cryptosporangium arvum]|uniref:4Fe-4S domain-containing protein n=1 Tax=Cryptosporangium arvum TaxID=80871 RepID=UPI00055B585E